MTQKKDTARSKPKLTKDLKSEAQDAASGDKPNPVFVCLAGAGYEACRCIRLFMGESTEAAKKQFADLPAHERSDMIEDAMHVVAGAEPPDLYMKYSEGTLWEAVDPVEKVLWTTFCATVKLQFEAIKHLAAASQSVKGGANDA
jgi:hypothetical protein